MVQLFSVDRFRKRRSHCFSYACISDSTRFWAPIQRLHNSSDYIKWFTEQIKCHELEEEKGENKKRLVWVEGKWKTMRRKSNLNAFMYIWNQNQINKNKMINTLTWLKLKIISKMKKVNLKCLCLYDWIFKRKSCKEKNLCKQKVDYGLTNVREHEWKRRSNRWWFLKWRKWFKVAQMWIV